MEYVWQMCKDSCFSAWRGESLMSTKQLPKHISKGGIFSRQSASPALAHAGHAVIKCRGSPMGAVFGLKQVVVMWFLQKPPIWVQESALVLFSLFFRLIVSILLFSIRSWWFWLSEFPKFSGATGEVRLLRQVLQFWFLAGQLYQDLEANLGYMSRETCWFWWDLWCNIIHHDSINIHQLFFDLFCYTLQEAHIALKKPPCVMRSLSYWNHAFPVLLLLVC